jgi:hypothetical protein
MKRESGDRPDTSSRLFDSGGRVEEHIGGLRLSEPQVHEYSDFARHANWGRISSSWAALFINVFDQLSTRPDARPLLGAFFCRSRRRGAHAAKISPCHTGERNASLQQATQLLSILPSASGFLCASCPLVSQEARVRMNREWMRNQLEKKILLVFIMSSNTDLMRATPPIYHPDLPAGLSGTESSRSIAASIYHD